MRRAVFCLVVAVVASLAAPASAAVRWTQDGKPIARGDGIQFVGVGGAVQFHLSTRTVQCTGSFSVGTLVAGGVRRLRRAYTGCTIEGGGSCQTGATPQRIVTRNLRGKTVVLDNGHVGLLLKKRSLAKFVCALNNEPVRYQLRGTLVEDLGVPLGSTVSSLSASLICQDLVTVVRPPRRPPEEEDTVVSVPGAEIIEPTISQEQFAATGSGESFAVACPNVIGD